MNKIIIVGAAALMSVSLVACGNSKSNTSSNSATSSKKVAPKYYKVGDTVKVGKVTYTLKSVEVTSERNEFADDQPKNVIKVVYHVKNNDDKDLPIGADLNVYGPDNSKLKTYPIDNTTVDAIAPGKEADVTTGFGADKLGTFELQFSPLVSTEKPVKFRVKVKSEKNIQKQNQQTSQQATQTPQQAQGAQTSNEAQSQEQTRAQDDEISSAQDAVNAARAKYGDNGGDYMWGALSQNPDGSYFIKAISRQQLQDGSMTGTAQSVNVYPDGTIISN